MDDSGSWGRGGFFWAIAKISPAPQKNYETAAEMGDLHLGDAHLVQIDDNSMWYWKKSLALTCFQHMWRIL